MNDNIKIVGFIILILFLVVFGPLCTIWSLNTLFPALAIPYTFSTWSAIILLGLWAKGIEFNKSK
jgi:hypothetical protein